MKKPIRNKDMDATDYANHKMTIGRSISEPEPVDEELIRAANAGTKSLYGVLKFIQGAKWQKKRQSK